VKHFLVNIYDIDIFGFFPKKINVFVLSIIQFLFNL